MENRSCFDTTFLDYIYYIETFDDLDKITKYFNYAGTAYSGASESPSEYLMMVLCGGIGQTGNWNMKNSAK